VLCFDAIFAPAAERTLERSPADQQRWIAMAPEMAYLGGGIDLFDGLRDRRPE
jgi:hypothetical protein